MSSGSAPVSALDRDRDDSTKTRSISELISTLRTAYRMNVFDQVEEILVAREAEWKSQIEDVKKNNSLLHEQYEVQKLDLCCLEEELSKQKKENKDLKRLVAVEKGARDVAEQKERTAEERYEKLLEDVKKGEQEEEKSVIFKLRKKCRELECSKVMADGEIELWKGRFRALEIRVSSLEEDTAMLVNVGLQVSRNCYGNASEIEEKGSSGKSGLKNGNHTVPLTSQVNGLDCKGNTSIVRDGGLTLHSSIEGNGDLQSAASARTSSGSIIIISASDDDCALGGTLCGKEMNSENFADKVCPDTTPLVDGSRILKRKHHSSVNMSENANGDSYEEEDDIYQTSKQKMKQRQELDKLMDMLDDSSSSSDSDDSFSFLNHTSLLGPRNRNNPCFEFEEDMIAEFEKDAELCMKAVCALYRQQTSVSKSPMCLEFSSNQSPGFNKYDALRGTTLAEFLIDGDTEGKLRKSATELEQHDKNGLSDCKRLAIGHSKQLFEIFRK